MVSPGGSSEDEIRDEQRRGEIVVQVFKGELPPPTPPYVGMLVREVEREKVSELAHFSDKQTQEGR